VDALPFRYEDDPDAPGWKRWELPAANKFNSFLGPLSVKVEDGIARVRMTPGERHSNLRGNVHGGAFLGFIDVAMFAAARGFGVLTAGTPFHPVHRRGNGGRTGRGAGRIAARDRTAALHARTDRAGGGDDRQL